MGRTQIYTILWLSILRFIFWNQISVITRTCSFREKAAIYTEEEIILKSQENMKPRGYISQQAWEHLGIPQKELKGVIFYQRRLGCSAGQSLWA